MTAPRDLLLEARGVVEAGDEATGDWAALYLPDLLDAFERLLTDRDEIRGRLSLLRELMARLVGQGGANAAEVDRMEELLGDLGRVVKEVPR